MIGCAATPHKNSLEYDLSSIQQVRVFIATGGDVNQLDRFGRTPLHYAVSNYPDIVPVLLNAGAKVNIQDNEGYTPLHLATKYRSSVISMLLISGADVSISMNGVGRCKRPRRGVFESVNPYQLAQACLNAKALKVFDEFAEDSVSWHSAMEINSFQSYEGYVNSFPSGMFLAEAKERYDSLRQAAIDKLKGDQPCQLKEPNWYLVSGACKDGFAHSDGEAISLDGQKYIGEFYTGWRKKGLLYNADEIVFDGGFSLGQPHGKGVCRFENELEECTLYNGERIGAFFKQRALYLSQMEGLRSDIEQLQRTLNRQVNQTAYQAKSTSKDYSYLTQLNSKDKATRNVSRIKAAVDLIGFFAKAASEN